MHAEFWLQRWQQNRIGFHHDQPMPLLQKHWPVLALPKDSRVLVPLAGKSLDMLWLAAQGHRVLGVELSPLAVQQFLADNRLHADVHDSPMGRHHVISDRIEIIQGDVLGLDEATLASCAAVYDRAAVIALPADMRKRYARAVYDRLPRGSRGLMITLEYPQQEMDGPPFSVDTDEVHALLGARFEVERLERRDILSSQPKFSEQGVTSLHTSVHTLRRTAT